MTEGLHPRAEELDAMTARELVSLMHSEDAIAVAAIAPQLDHIARAVEAITERLRAGGRLHYFGAGTSGLVAAMDAAECPPTFGVADDLVQAHVVTSAGQEDDAALGETLAREARVGHADVAVAVSASGNTPFVVGAMREASRDHPLTVSITCRPESSLAGTSDIAIEVSTGPEVIAGSTRLKCGTVQKLVLNMISTAVFTRMGRTHRGRMVGVVAGNEKQRNRAARIIADLSGLSLIDARRVLDESGGDVRAALASVAKR